MKLFIHKIKILLIVMFVLVSYLWIYEKLFIAVNRFEVEIIVLNNFTHDNVS